MKIAPKLTSRKFWITIWSMGMLTYALIAQVDLAWFNGLAPILGSVPIFYMGANAYTTIRKDNPTQPHDNQK
jgi:hypothetical protein